VEAAIRCERRDVGVPVERDVGGDEDEVEAPGEFGERGLVVRARENSVQGGEA
jgi:hypothetical protein